MTRIRSLLMITLCITAAPLCASARKAPTLYAGLDTGSLSQLTAFYHLYPETPEGKRALSHIEELLLIAPRFKNHQEDIDITRAVLLTQEGLSMQEIAAYETKVDLMALQIAARLPRDASAQEKIEAINRFIFDEAQFRFPARRQWIETIDTYTFLPSVLDSHRGVCLGVSILYLGVAQRLGLSLEAVTPPGHIYLRHKIGDLTINIETTARGIDLPDEVYLGIEPPPLQTRTIKEVVGLSHINHASVFLRRHQYEKALLCYQKAADYLPDDPQLLEFQGCIQLLLGDVTQGKHLLERANKQKKSRLAEDYLSGKIDRNGLEIAVIPAEEKREALLEKKEALSSCLERFPLFRDGWYALGFICLELHNPQEALRAFESYHAIDSSHPSVEYHLAALNIHLWNYPKAWKHLELVEKLTKDAGHQPKALKQLRALLMQKSPLSD